MGSNLEQESDSCNLLKHGILRRWRTTGKCNLLWRKNHIHTLMVAGSWFATFVCKELNLWRWIYNNEKYVPVPKMWKIWRGNITNECSYHWSKMVWKNKHKNKMLFNTLVLLAVCGYLLVGFAFMTRLKWKTCMLWYSFNIIMKCMYQMC